LEFTANLHGLKVVPPSSTPSDGTGHFVLTGNVFTYDIFTDFAPGFRGKIYGPALPGVNAGPLYDLNLPISVPPLPPYRDGYTSYTGSLLLTDAQIPDLMSKLWYVQLNDRLFPELAMRGQIVPVPEPTGVVLIALVVGIWGFQRIRLGRL